MKFRNLISEILLENIQLANKIYFNKELLDSKDKKIILNITNGDYTTNLICKMYYDEKVNGFSGIEKLIGNLPTIHQSLLSYNKNVLPIKGFDFNSTINIKNSIIERSNCLDIFKKLPTEFYRNIKSDIRVERYSRGLKDFFDKIEYISQHLSYLENRDEESKKKVLNKVFKSNTTVEEILDFMEEKENLLGGKQVNRETLMKIINEECNYTDVIYDKKNVVVLRVGDSHDIKLIGCNSLWCFTYGQNNHNDWYKYSHNDMVYLIIDFNMESDDKNFMHVLIEPLKSEYGEDEFYPLFDMSNDNYTDPHSFLNYYFNKNQIKKLFDFDYEY